jgi:uncharacterized protein (DUF1697 family)
MGMRYVALLRGINVGGKNKLPMKDLAAMFADAGCKEVRTYIQSGNVVFSAPAAVAAKTPGRVGAQIAKQFGYRVPVILRSGEELARLAEGNPFFTAKADPTKLLVMFLEDEPSARSVAALDPKRSPPDEFMVRGREIYLRCPNGFGQTKLGNDYFDRVLETISTGRNWRTVLQLLEMARAA